MPVRAHVERVSTDGLVILGVPNLRGVNSVLLERLTPSLLALHNREAMALTEWDRFERELGLTCLLREYIGGFDASTFWRCESRRVRDRVLHQVLWRLSKVLERPGPRLLRRMNSRLWSGYLIGVYKVTG